MALSSEKLAERKSVIGGSDVPIIAGLSKYKSILELYQEKAGLIELSNADSEAAYWGEKLEPLVADEFTHRTGLKLVKESRLLKHKKFPWMGANIDRRILDTERGPGIFEAKTANQFKLDEWEDANVPFSYQLQVQHYLAVTGYAYAYIGCLVGGQQYKYYHLLRDEEIIDMLYKLEADFWRCVVKKEPPLADGSEATEKYIKNIYRRGDPDSCVILGEDAIEASKLYLAANKQRLYWEKQEKLYKNLLTNQMGINTKGYAGEYEVLWTNGLQTRLDTDKIKEEKPEIYEQYSKTNEFRKFSIKQKNNTEVAKSSQVGA